MLVQNPFTEQLLPAQYSYCIRSGPESSRAVPCRAVTHVVLSVPRPATGRCGSMASLLFFGAPGLEEAERRGREALLQSMLYRVPEAQNKRVLGDCKRRRERDGGVQGMPELAKARSMLSMEE